MKWVGDVSQADCALLLHMTEWTAAIKNGGNIFEAEMWYWNLKKT